MGIYRCLYTVVFVFAMFFYSPFFSIQKCWWPSLGSAEPHRLASTRHLKERGKLKTHWSWASLLLLLLVCFLHSPPHCPPDPPSNAGWIERVSLSDAACFVCADRRRQLAMKTCSHTLWGCLSAVNAVGMAVRGPEWRRYAAGGPLSLGRAGQFRLSKVASYKKLGFHPSCVGELQQWFHLLHLRKVRTVWVKGTQRLNQLARTASGV